MSVKGRVILLNLRKSYVLNQISGKKNYGLSFKTVLNAQWPCDIFIQSICSLIFLQFIFKVFFLFVFGHKVVVFCIKQCLLMNLKFIISTLT